MTTKYRSPYHKLLAELVEHDELSGIGQKMFEVFLREDGRLASRDLIRLVFEGEVNEIGEEFRQDQKEAHIRWGIEELWDHAIPILSCGRGYYVLGNNPDTVLSEIHDLEQKIRTLQRKVDSMRVHYVKQLKPFARL